jgi:hypothetical protein
MRFCFNMPARDTFSQKLASSNSFTDTLDNKRYLSFLRNLTWRLSAFLFAINTLIFSEITHFFLFN